MTEKNKKNNHIPPTSLLGTSVFDRIKEESICPKGKWYFTFGSLLLWLFWVCTVLIGALVFAEAVYLSMHSGIELYEVTHTNLLSFIFEALPLIWLCAFFGVVVLAYFNLRKTKCGYRYSVWKIVASSIVGTVLGGLAFHYVGADALFEKMLVEQMPGYQSVHQREEFMWQHPEYGRIVGVFVERGVNTQSIHFRDMNDLEWIVLTHELPPQDLSLLVSGAHVRLMGEADMTVVPHTFYVCGVLPSMPEGGHSISTLRELRKIAEEKFNQFSKEPLEVVLSQPSMRCRDIMRVVFHRSQ